MARKFLKGRKKPKLKHARKEMRQKTADFIARKKKERNHKICNKIPLDVEIDRKGKPLKTKISKSQSAKDKNLTALGLLQNQQAMGNNKKDRTMNKKTLQQKKKEQEFFIRYNKHERILLVGEGNFSFARSLVERPFFCGSNLVATCYDDKDTLLSKYKVDVEAEQIQKDNKESKLKENEKSSESDKNDKSDKKSSTKKSKGSISKLKQKLLEKNNEAVDEDGDETESMDVEKSGDGDKKDQKAKADDKEEKADEDEEMNTESEEEEEGSESESDSEPVFNQDVKTNLKTLRNAGVETMVSVDCRELSNIRNGALKGEFDRIVWQFPHSGSGETDQEKNILEHKKLLTQFFQECEKCLDKSNQKAEIHVTLKQGEPYSSWKIGPTCQTATQGRIQIKTAFQFNANKYPGYCHRRTIGFKQDLSASGNEEIMKQGAKTYVFGWNKKEWKKEMED